MVDSEDAGVGVRAAVMRYDLWVTVSQEDHADAPLPKT